MYRLWGSGALGPWGSGTFVIVIPGDVDAKSAIAAPCCIEPRKTCAKRAEPFWPRSYCNWYSLMPFSISFLFFPSCCVTLPICGVSVCEGSRAGQAALWHEARAGDADRLAGRRSSPALERANHQTVVARSDQCACEIAGRPARQVSGGLSCL